MAPAPDKDPWAGPPTIENVTGLPSTSDAVRVTTRVPSSSTLTACAFATGASLTAVTVIVTAAVPSAPAASRARNVKLSVPL